MMNERETATEESVWKSLEPELSLIHEKAMKAWTMTCRIGGYARLEDMPTELYERHPPVLHIAHQKDTTRIAKAIVDAIAEFHELDVNEDYVLTASLCHDVGKPCEWRSR